MRERWRGGWDSGERFALLSAATSLAIFSLVSGKQTHYLLPIFPLISLFAARALDCAVAQPDPKGWVYALPALPLALFGLLLLVLPGTGMLTQHAEWAGQLSPLGGVLILLAVTLALLLKWRLPSVVWPGVLSVLFLAATFSGIFSQVASNYEVNVLGSAIGEAQREGRAVVVFGKYHGEFNFAGRLTQPVREIAFADFSDWLQRHPNGVIVVRAAQPPQPGEGGIRSWQRYRLSYLELRDAASWEPNEATADL